MNYSVLSRVLLMLALMASMVSCNKDDNGGVEPAKDYKYLREVTAERKIDKADIISVLDKAFPELNIASLPFVLLIKDI